VHYITLSLQLILLPYPQKSSFCISRWTCGSLCLHFNDTTSCLFSGWSFHME